MIRKLLPAALAACALGLVPLPASAAVAAVDCDFYGAGIVGYILSDAAEELTIACELWVNGTVVHRTATGSGTGFAYVVEPAPPLGVIPHRICAIYSVNGGAVTAMCKIVVPDRRTP